MNTATQTPAVDHSASNATIAKVASDSAAPSKSNPSGIVKRSNAYFTTLDALEIEPGFNNRFDMGEIDELAKSIKANGLMNGLRVQRSGIGKFKIIGGHRRHAALSLIAKNSPDHPALAAIPVTIIDSTLNEVEQTIQMFEDNGGKPLLPMEEAIAFKKLRDAGMTIKAITQRVGRKQMHVTEMLALLNGDEELINAVKDGSIGVTLAKRIAVVAKDDKAKQRELVQEAKSVPKNAKAGKARKAIKAKVEDARRAKAKAAGKKLKMRALTDDQLHMLGEKLSGYLMEQMAAIGLDPEADLVKWMKGADDDCKVAFTFGTLQAMKAAAGIDDTVLIF